MPNVRMVVTNVRRSEVAELTTEESMSTIVWWGSTCETMPELTNCSMGSRRGATSIRVVGEAYILESWRPEGMSLDRRPFWVY